MNQSIKLKYVNAEYLDALLGAVSKAFESAGNKGRELLNIALKTVMNISFRYAMEMRIVSVNPAIGVELPKQVEKTAYHGADPDPAGKEQRYSNPYAGAVECAYGTPQVRNQWGKIF